MRVLVIDDDTHIREFLEAHLPPHGFAVDAAGNGVAGAALASRNGYDLILLDLNLPDLMGEEIVGRLRGRNMPPILMLTVVSDTPSKIRVLNAGADDYLVKPFALDELVARMRALLRRSRSITPDILSVDDLELDANRRLVRRAGREVRLTPKEFALLEYLLRRAGNAVPRATLVEHAWDSSADALSGAVDTHLSNLRRKLGKPELIYTIRGKGYSIG